MAGLAVVLMSEWHPPFADMSIEGFRVFGGLWHFTVTNESDVVYNKVHFWGFTWKGPYKRAQRYAIKAANKWNDWVLETMSELG